MTDEKQLVLEAIKARQFAYAPYSRFTVGAALLSENERVFTGCNIESASYSPSVCAERTAFFKAVSEGERKFRKIAIVGGKAGEPIHHFCPPCGVCRQVMMEFCDPKTFQIILACDEKTMRRFLLEDLLPFGFGPETLR